MADIVDRLISRVEFQGTAGATDSLFRLVRAHVALKESMESVNTVSAAMATAQARVASTTARLAALQKAYDAAITAANAGGKGSVAALNRASRIQDVLIPTAFAQQEKAILNAAKAQKALNAATLEYGMIQENNAMLRAGLGVAGGIIAAVAITQFAVAVGKTAIEFERFENQLAILYRSRELGKAALDWIVQFARETPFSVESATEAFVRLNALGIQPTRRNLMAMGGLAKMFNRDFSDVAMAVGIGASGNFSRLIRGFGITREDVAKNAAPGVIPAHGPITNFDAAQRAIITTFEKKFPQALQIFQGSAEVAISNMKDAWEQLKRAVAGPSGAQNISSAAVAGQIAITHVTQFIRLMQIGLSLWSAIVNQIILQLIKAFDFFGGGRVMKALGMGWTHDFVKLAAEKNRNESVKRASDIARDFMNTWQGISGEPPKPPGVKGPQDTASSMNQFIRQVVGASGIAQIGVNASELPGIQSGMKKPPLTVKLEGSEGSNFMALMEEAFNKLLYDANRHGLSLQPNRG